MKKSAFVKLNRMMAVNYTEMTPFGVIDKVALYDPQVISEEDMNEAIKVNEVFGSSHTSGGVGWIIMTQYVFESLFLPNKLEKNKHDCDYKNQLFGCRTASGAMMCRNCPFAECDRREEAYLDLEGLYALYKITAKTPIPTNAPEFAEGIRNDLDIIDAAIQERLKLDIIEDCSQHH